jgi:hypothetical protein
MNEPDLLIKRRLAMLKMGTAISMTSLAVSLRCALSADSLLSRRLAILQ